MAQRRVGIRLDGDGVGAGLRQGGGRQDEWQQHTKRLLRRTVGPRYSRAMRLLPLTLSIAIGCGPLLAADEKSKTAERLEDSAVLFTEIMGTPDRSIPQDLLDKS